jgi:hypothetical protein
VTVPTSQVNGCVAPDGVVWVSSRDIVIVAAGTAVRMVSASDVGS